MEFKFTGLDKYSSDRVLEKIEFSVEELYVFLVVRNESGKITEIERVRSDMARRYETKCFYCYKSERKRKKEALNGFYIQVDSNSIRLHRAGTALSDSLKEELENVGDEKVEFFGEEVLASEVIKLLVKLNNKKYRLDEDEKDEKKIENLEENDMIILKLKDFLKERGISSYALRKDNILTNTTWKNVQEGEKVSLGTLNKICDYTNCKLSDLVEYVAPSSYLAKWYTLKKYIEDAEFDEDFISICNEYLDSRNCIKLESLAEEYEDKSNKDNAKSEMLEILKLDKLIHTFKETVVNAKNVKHFERVSYLEKLEEFFINLKCDMNAELANGSLSKLCNLNAEFSWAEYLDVYLEFWRQEHKQEDDDGNVNYYDMTGYELVQNFLNDKEFLELVDALLDCFESEVEEYQNLIFE